MAREKRALSAMSMTQRFFTMRAERQLIKDTQSSQKTAHGLAPMAT
jgi:hypothetical protein